MREMKCWCFIVSIAPFVLKYKGSRVQILYQHIRYYESSILSPLPPLSSVGNIEISFKHDVI